MVEKRKWNQEPEASAKSRAERWKRRNEREEGILNTSSMAPISLGDGENRPANDLTSAQQSSPDDQTSGSRRDSLEPSPSDSLEAEFNYPGYPLRHDPVFTSRETLDFSTSPSVTPERERRPTMSVHQPSSPEFPLSSFERQSSSSEIPIQPWAQQLHRPGRPEILPSGLEIQPGDLEIQQSGLKLQRSGLEIQPSGLELPTQPSVYLPDNPVRPAPPSENEPFPVQAPVNSTNVHLESVEIAVTYIISGQQCPFCDKVLGTPSHAARHLNTKLCRS